MGVRVKATGNIDEVLRAFDDLEQSILDTAIPRALNTLADQADFAGRKAIRDIYGISTRDLAPYFEVGIASARDLRASIKAKGKGFPLRFFKPRQTREGVVVTIKGRQVLFRHAFLANLGGDRNVFARGKYGADSVAAARRRRGRRKAGLAAPDGGNVFRASGESMGKFAFGLGRFPITLLRSSSPPDALGNPDVIDAMNARVDEQAAKVLVREIRAARRGY